MNEFTIESFEAYLRIVRDELGSTEQNGKKVRPYFRGQGKRALAGYDLIPSIGRYSHLQRLTPFDRDQLEQDVLETIEDELDMCLIHKASDYDTALQHLLSYTYDVVILDIMGVNGFELLKTAVSRGFPTVMLTAYAITPEALKKSIKLGAVSFLPKENMSELETFLEDVVLGGGKSVWQKLFDKLGDYFDKRFGPGWKEKDQFFKEFQEELTKSRNERP